MIMGGDEAVFNYLELIFKTLALKYGTDVLCPGGQTGYRLVQKYIVL